MQDFEGKKKRRRACRPVVIALESKFPLLSMENLASSGRLFFVYLYYAFFTLKEDNTEMIAYVLSSANKFYPDESLNDAEDMNI